MVTQTSPRELARLTHPLYSYSEADRLANLTRGTARRWLAGYTRDGRAGARVELPPVTGRDREPGDGSVSFLDLIELIAIRGLKQQGFGLPRIRQVVDYCRDQLHTDYPLASLPLKVGGRDIFVEHEDRLLNVLRHRGSRAWSEVLEPFLATLDYREAFGSRWWPLGKGRTVVVDPDYGFGLPVVAGSGVRTEIILERAQVGDPAGQIARDFNIGVDAVEQALEFERTRQAA